MIGETGIWSIEEGDKYHVFDYYLAQWIGQHLPKDVQVIDLGCGKATYLRYLHDIGFESLLGVEGGEQHFEFGNVLIHDLTTPLELDVSGNVICLEVGEHLFEEHLPIFLDNVVKYCTDKIIYSHAVPSQDGIGHVSCRHNIWVINEMNKRGFMLLTGETLSVRSVIQESTAWFRNSLMIFEKINIYEEA